MEDANKVIVTDCITGLGTEEYAGYLFHGLCIGGRCLFRRVTMACADSWRSISTL